MTTATAPLPTGKTQQPSRAFRNPSARSAPKRKVSFGKIKPQGHRIGIYGPGGIGKTTLAATAPGPAAFVDLDDSLPILSPQLTGLNIRRVDCSITWQDVRNALHGDGWDEIQTIVIDSATKAEELCARWVLDNIKTDKGVKPERIEDYGWGKGYTHIYETFLTLLGDLDAHVRAGRNVVLIMHDCTSNVPNPKGEDYIRWEPRLQSLSSGKASVRLRVREWLDHLLYVGYDVECEKKHQGKARGTGTRTIYPQEMPYCMAKSRALRDPIELVQFDTTVWNLMFGKEQ